VANPEVVRESKNENVNENGRGGVLPLVSVVVLNHNGLTQNRDAFLRCLQSCVGSEYPNKEVLLVDNGSTDSSISFVRSLYRERIRYVLLDRNLGYSGGMRAGARMVDPRARYIVFTNNDVFFPPETIGGLVGFLEAHPDVGVANCIEIVPRRDYNPGGTYLDMRLSHVPPRDLSKPYFVTAAENFFVIRRDVYERVGGFDPNFFQVYDDQDLCLRVWMSGYRVACDTHYSVTHMHRLPNKKTPIRWYRYIRNRYIVILKLYDPSFLAAYLPLRVITDLYYSVFDPKWRSRRSIVLVVRALRELVSKPNLFLPARERFMRVKKVSERELLRLGILRP